MRIFISSRAAGNSEWREAIDRACTAAGHEPIRMPERGSRDPNVRAYMGVLADCDIVIYLADEPSEPVLDEVSAALSDGKPVIMLTATKKTPDGDRVLTDYAKALRKEGPLMVYPFDDIDNLTYLVRVSVEEVIARRFSEPRKPIAWGPDTYSRSVDMMRTTSSRFAFAQETSSLVLGPHRSWFSAEQRFLDSFFGLVAKLRSNSTLEIVHLFDIEATRRALLAHPQEYPDYEIWSRRLLDAATGSYADRLHICGVHPRISPFMVADDMVMLGHHIGPLTRTASFHRGVGEWAMDMWNQTKGAVRTDGVDISSALTAIIS